MVAIWYHQGYREDVSAITLKGIPDELAAALKAKAAESRRSLNSEILHRLEKSLDLEMGSTSFKEEAAIQADAWSRLSGAWISGASVEEEIDALYSARSEGRDWDLNW